MSGQFHIARSEGVTDNRDSSPCGPELFVEVERSATRNAKIAGGIMKFGEWPVRIGVGSCQCVY